MTRRIVAEALGTAFLLATVIGSGIMAERLAGGNMAIALLANTIATGAVLVTLIIVFGSLSGAHFNPLVTLSAKFQGEISGREALGYIAAQFLGAVLGAITANVMFSEPAISFSRHSRSGAAQAFSECVAAFGLVLVIRICARTQPGMIAFAVGGYITAAYWFTSSTSFANPAVTLARSLSDTFAGIRPIDVPLFVIAQVVGATAAVVLAKWLINESSETVIR